MSGLTWLNDLMVWLAKWVPRPLLVTSRHRALVFRPGDVVTDHKPGLLIYWPIIHLPQIVSMQLRTMCCSAQLHGQEVVQIVVSWIIVDPRLALLSLNDISATVHDWALAALGSSYAPALTGDELGARTADALRRRLASHGIEVRGIQVTQRGWALPLRNLNDWAPRHEHPGLDGGLY
jgi:regulator of protease activity HflC (stomatin/prohibitin superfamily)